NHNFFRLWAWELTRSTQGRAENVWYRHPFQWLRTGPGTATDGTPKFDLSRFDQTYFDRMRERVIAARDRGIYVCVMLFDGFGPQFDRNPHDGFPFDGKNNINGIACGGTESQSLSNPAVTALQEAYVRKVVDTVNDLDNVLYEVANEAGVYSTEWQYHIIKVVKEHEAQKPAQHPIGMTFQYDGGTDQALWDSDADWISPSGSGGYGHPSNPPVADGRKVVVNDTDHSLYYIGLLEAGDAGQRAWAWKNFLRGNSTLFMDPYLLPWPGRNNPRGARVDPQWDMLRRNLGYTRAYAQRMNLTKALPSTEIASSRCCLADPGRSYCVYLPDGGAVTVDLSAASGDMRVEWFDPASGERVSAPSVAGGARRHFAAPFGGDAVLFISRD
ncbi:MAG: putative collagen-binding domain-containing protein, partial [Armatimonadota bacterium]